MGSGKLDRLHFGHVNLGTILPLDVHLVNQVGKKFLFLSGLAKITYLIRNRGFIQFVVNGLRTGYIRPGRINEVNREVGIVREGSRRHRRRIALDIDRGSFRSIKIIEGASLHRSDAAIIIDGHRYRTIVT